MIPTAFRSYLLLFLFSLFLSLGLGLRPCGAGEIRHSIDTMNFRSVEEDDPLLGPRVKQSNAFYSIRPPAEWVQKTSGLDNPHYRHSLFFADPENGDSLSIGLIEGGPQDLTIESLSRFRGDYLGTFRKSKLGKIVGSDLYRFGHFLCLQALFQKNHQLTLQLLVFNQPGTFLQAAFQIDDKRYHSLAREVEACIASLKWPELQ